MFNRMRILIAVLIAAAALAVVPVAAQDETAHEVTVRRLYSEVINANDVTPLEELLADDFSYTNPAGTFDQAGYAALLMGRAAALPDQHTSFELVIGDGDLAVERHLFQGTFTGEYPTPTGNMLPPNNAPVMVYGHNVYHFNEAGEITQIEEYFDLVSFYTQLGIFPAPEGMATMEAPAGMMMEVEAWEVTEMSEDYEQMTRENIPNVIQAGLLEGDEDVLRESFTEDFVRHGDPANPMNVTDRAAFMADASAFRAAMPDLTITLDDLVVDGNFAAFTLWYEGTFENELSTLGMMIPPTNGAISIPVSVIVRMDEEGHTVEAWEAFDHLTFGTQFGLVQQ